MSCKSLANAVGSYVEHQDWDMSMNYNSRSWVSAACSMVLLFFAACSPTADTDVSAEAPVAESDVTPPSGVAATDVEDSKTKIVMLGDSLTAGFGLAPSEALPEQVERLLADQAYSVEVINAGVSGDTSAGGLARYDWSVASVDPDVLILALGANDYLSGQDPAQTRENLSAIIDQSLAADIEVLLVSLSSRSSDEDDPRAAEFAEIYPSLAEAYDLALYEGMVDPIFDKPEFLMADGLHPTAAGVELMAVPMAAAIASLLPSGEDSE